MKRIVYLLLTILTFGSCNKEKYFKGPDFFEDGFEDYDSLPDLLLPEDQLWSFTQQTLDENILTVDSAFAHSGTRSLKFEADKTGNGIVSKCSIAKHNMAFWEGETIRMNAFYFIQDTLPLEWLFLMDIEEQTAIGAGPGMRIALVDNKLRIEYKFNEKDILQPDGHEIEFPRNQWVELTWEIKLSQKHKGSVRLWQDGILIIDSQNNRTLPEDILYFQQGTKGMYSSFEIGITANSYDNHLVMWADDIRIEKVN